MAMRVKKLNHAEKDSLLVNQAFLRKFAGRPSTVKVHFGAWNRQLKVRVSQSLPSDTIGISSQSLGGYSLPPLKYKVLVKGNNVHIGPVLGIVAFKPGAAITMEKIKKYNDYLRPYSSIQGLIYICRADDISLQARKIRGYYYSPEGAKSKWTLGTFPYPSALYRRAALNPPTYKALKRVLGPRLFNGYFLGDHFNKWKLWRWLSPHPAIRKHLPHTKKLQSRKDLDEMLARYNAVYLKPTMESMARGIIKAVRKGDGYQFIYPENNKKASPYRIVSKGSTEVAGFLANLLREHQYIVQQGIEMKRQGSRGIDFRVIMQKNEQLQWSCTGVIARFGKKNGIVTNFTSAGFASKGLNALQGTYGYSRSRSQLTQNRMIEICTKACKIFDSKGGNYADIGVDVMVDKNGHIYVLEVNILPDHHLALYAKQRDLYLKQVAKPLLYANALVGFKASK
ncbi:YheC/YheD family protein [Paenibacillus sp. ATY16]|uniref:YheC/YheD family endospore coat-associated protein n=1 Tax=Paenibacillus sp. ATY16 TaxID=1759312 RepID=UPI00200C5C9A|nr:YheC/YheD family protein [Paenibacillus sp. ATY16]MCK9859026.1 YheC/YheD family protein [Paenibacillus sp. ATY16]